MNHLIENVKASVSLQVFLEEHGAQFRKVGGNWRSDFCPCCGASRADSNKLGLHSGDQKWRCFSCGRGGDVIDAAAALWCMPHRDALKRLAGEQWVSAATPVMRRRSSTDPSANQARQAALNKALERLREGVGKLAPDPEVMAYMTKVRGIPGRVIAKAQALKMLGFLPAAPFQARLFLEDTVGQDLMLESGLWKEGQKIPAIAYRPIVFFLPGMDSAEFRLCRKPNDGERKAIRYGSASRPWYWAGEDSRLAVVEGAVDLLSLVALGFKGDIIGLPGASVWRPEWFAGASRVLVCLDPDKAGQNATTRILAACERLGIPAINRAPKNGDVNDNLRLKLAA